MKHFKNLKIKVKMLISFGIVIAIMVALALVSIQELMSINDSYTYTIQYSIDAKFQMLDLRGLVRDMRRTTISISAYASSDDTSKIEEFYDESTQCHSDALRLLDSFNASLENDPGISEENKSKLTRVSEEVREDLHIFKEKIILPTYETGLRGEQEESLEIIAEGTDIAEELRAKINEIIAVADEIMDADTAKANETASQIVIILICVSVAATVIAFIIALYMAKLISAPLLPLVAFMRRAGENGDIALSGEDMDVISKYSMLKDELGNTISSSAKFARRVMEIANTLEEIAGGDLTVELELLSDKDVIGASLKKMTDNLNDMFAEISLSSSQVTTGASQVADGSQSLAQGSTEQAASVEELSASISSVSESAKQNAKMAGEAAVLSDTIKADAEHSSEQMDNLMTAVSEISDASNSISNVIKVIDDIAFQTNILALNAAVEAARAGQHGKGFAVVAEEVRSLAAKSAESARETGKLIENSTEKSNLGLAIATKASESLKGIVSGIKHSAEIVGSIAQASDEQSGAIAQINTGIEQVTQVIQQNSATAQQSAAASEQMSGQATILQELVNRFKYKSAGLDLPDKPLVKQLPGKHSESINFGKY